MSAKKPSSRQQSSKNLTVPHKSGLERIKGKDGKLLENTRIVATEYRPLIYRNTTISPKDHKSTKKPNSNRISLSFNKKDEPLLTPTLLAKHVLPIINALFEIERIINKASQPPPKITSITQASPISISFEGLNKAYENLRDEFIPFRREHQKAMLRLEAYEKKADIEKKRADVAAAMAMTKKDEAEAQRIFAEAEKLRIESEKLASELRMEQMNFALSLTEKLSPDATQAERLDLLNQLLPHISAINFSKPEISIPKKQE